MVTNLHPIALLIDADNVADLKADQLAQALSQLEEFGIVSLRKAYGNWSRPNLDALSRILHEFAIIPIQQFDYTSGKNATDIALAIDAMDLMYSSKFSGFCIISCDSDFTPLVVRLRNESLAVYGFGRSNKTALAFQQACTKFFDLGTAQSHKESGVPNETTQPEALHQAQTKTNTKAKKNNSSATIAVEAVEKIFRKAVKENLDASGWASAAAIGAYLTKQQKRKKDYKTQSWAKYYQKFPTVFEVKPSKGKTQIRMRPE